MVQSINIPAIPADANLQPAEPAFGPSLYGAALHINEPFLFDFSRPVTVDVETDEGTAFVGLAVCQSDTDVYYFSELTPELKEQLSRAQIVGHNVKYDLKQLIGWGVTIAAESLVFDTCLASYVVNTTRPSHSLKDLAADLLHMVWPTYKEMVGKGKAKLTLDKQEVGRVAAYCGMDALATYKLYRYFMKTMQPQQRRLLETLELPAARTLMKMELRGVSVDLDYLKELDVQFADRMGELKTQIVQMWHGGEELNINSNRQIAALLAGQGAVLPTTAKGNKKVDKATLKMWEHLPAVPLLLEYSKIEKLWSTYTQGLLERQRGGRIYATFNQITRDAKGTEVGINTGRLSSSNPNLQNIPARTEEGQLIMKAFLPEPGQMMVDADYSQIEPRLLAHFSKDRFLQDVYLNGKDIYEELVRGTGRTRQDGKTFMLALLYGAQLKKLAAVFACTEEDANRILSAMWRKIPSVQAWINRTKYEARQKKGVYTLNRRFIPLPEINIGNRFEKLHWERVAVNAIIQGSAAEVMKTALIKLDSAGYLPLLTVHDSGLFSVEHEEQANDIKRIMESVVTIDVPLRADIGTGNTWMEAKQ